MKGIMDFIIVKSVGRKKMNNGVTMMIARIANIEPYKVKIKASWALPFNKS